MSGSLEKKLKTTAWLLFVFFFLVYTFNSDKVYQVLTNKSFAVKLPDNFTCHPQGDLQYHVPFGIKSVNNQFEAELALDGSVLNIANESGAAKVRLFLRSPDALYEIPDNGLTFQATAESIHFNLFASTYELDSGIYGLGLYLADDEGKKFVWTDRFFEKAAGGPVEYIARPIILKPTRTSTDLKFAVEDIQKDRKELLIRGWVVLDNAEMGDYNAYILFKNSKNISRAFFAPLFTRMDIAAIYGNTRAANSGFFIKVPRGGITSGKHAVTLILESRKTGEALESVQVENINF